MSEQVEFDFGGGVRDPGARRLEPADENALDRAQAELDRRYERGGVDVTPSIHQWVGRQFRLGLRGMHTPEPFPGLRGVLRHDVDRYPHYIARKGDVYVVSDVNFREKQPEVYQSIWAASPSRATEDIVWLDIYLPQNNPPMYFALDEFTLDFRATGIEPSDAFDFSLAKLLWFSHGLGRDVRDASSHAQAPDQGATNEMWSEMRRRMRWAPVERGTAVIDAPEATSVRDPGAKRFTVKKHRVSGGYVVWDEKLDRATGSHDMRLEQARELAEIMNRHEEQQVAERRDPPDEGVRDSGAPPEVEAALAEITRRVAEGASHVHDSGCGCAHDPGKKMKKPSRAARWISRKIVKLQGEGRPHDQAVSIALDMARRRGYRVPARAKPKRRK